MTKKIFISYRRTELDRAKEIINIIESFGWYEIWYDDGYLLPGQEWWDTILDEIYNADIVLVFVSKAYLENELSILEFEYAKSLNKVIIPIRIDSSLAETDTREFAIIDYLDFRDGDCPKLEVALAFDIYRPLPDPLPQPPPAPMSPIIDFRIRLSAKPLTSDQQFILAKDLLHYRMDNPDEQADVDTIFDIFLNRNDISKEVHDLIIANLSGYSNPHSNSLSFQKLLKWAEKSNIRQILSIVSIGIAGFIGLQVVSNANEGVSDIGLLEIVLLIIISGFALSQIRKKKISAFVSYKRTGSWGIAEKIHYGLTTKKIDAFIDSKDLHAGDFEITLKEEVATRDYLVVILVKETLESEWVVKEIAYAFELGKTVIPVLIEGVKMEELDIPEEIAELKKQNAVSLYQKYFDAAIDEILVFLKPIA